MVSNKYTVWSVNDGAASKKLKGNPPKLVSNKKIKLAVVFPALNKAKLLCVPFNFRTKFVDMIALCKASVDKMLQFRTDCL